MHELILQELARFGVVSQFVHGGFALRQDHGIKEHAWVVFQCAGAITMIAAWCGR